MWIIPLLSDVFVSILEITERTGEGARCEGSGDEMETLVTLES